MNSQQKSYLAGLLDGDGSIMLQLKPNKQMRYLFRVKAVIIFYQDTKYIEYLNLFREWIDAGYVYTRNDRISELRIEGFEKTKKLITSLKPYLLFKKKQANKLLEALKLLRKKNYNLDDFLNVCQLADEISACNYISKQKKYTKKFIIQVLKSHNKIPVTTGIMFN